MGISGLWAKHVVQSSGFPQVIILLSFLITFGIIRGITYGIKTHTLPFGNVSHGGLHIHHYVWGIGLLLVVGYLQTAFHPHRGRILLTIAYGVATALILDEFALLLNLRDVYWSKQGQESVYAAAIAAGLLALAFLLREFIRAVIKEWRHR